MKLSVFTPSKPPVWMVALVIVYLTGQSFYPEFERSIFWGEIFLLILLISNIHLVYRFKSNARPYLVFCFYFIFVLPVIALLLGLNDDAFRWFFALRHWTYFGYALFFFFAFKYAHTFIMVINKLWPMFPILIGMTFFMEDKSVIGGSFIIGMLLIGIASSTKFRRFFIPFALLITLLMPIVFPSSSNIILSILLPILLMVSIWYRKSWRRYFYKTKLLKKMVITVLLFVMMAYVGLGVFAQQNQLLHRSSFSELVVAFDGIEDVNAVWRLAYWGVALSRLAEKPFGIGIGTPLIPVGSNKALAIGDSENREVAEYVVAPHNSLLTFVVRCGPFFTIPFLFLLWHLVSLLQVSITGCGINRAGGTQLLAALMFAVIAIVEASFNVVVESPLYAAAFWSALGIWVRLALDWKERYSISYGTKQLNPLRLKF